MCFYLLWRATVITVENGRGKYEEKKQIHEMEAVWVDRQSAFVSPGGLTQWQIKLHSDSEAHGEWI